MADLTNDSRFTHIAKDPRFRHMKKKDRKVKIDDRFHAMFKDDRFKVKYTVDKRGRPVKTTSNEHLRRYYDLSSSGDDSEEEPESQDHKIESKEKQSQKADKAAVKSGSKLEKRKKKVEKENDSEEESESEDPKTKSKERQVQKASATEGKTGSKVKKTKKKLGEVTPEQEQNTTGHQKKGKNSAAKVAGKPKGERKAVMHKSSLNEDSGDSSGSEEEEDADEDEDSSDADGDAAEATGNVGGEAGASGGAGESDSDSSGESDSDEEDDADSQGEDELDLARGQGNIESSSSDEDDDEEEVEDEEEEADHGWGELDRTAPVVEEATSRLAVCNMDWDRIKAADLMVLFNSFKPAGGTIKSVTIYPSEFGMKRMQEEDMMGPKEVVESARELQSQNLIETEEGDTYHRERLREYQLNRLKYYYAVVECDSANTANAIYEEADGVEYESSATKVDLRFVPEDMEFDQTPKSVCMSMPDGSTYKPTLFTNTALNQSKVDLTWDETDKDRISMTMRKFTKDDLEKMDFNDYLAGSSDDEEEGDDPYGGFEEPDFGTAGDEKNEDDEEQNIEKYKELIKGIKESEENKDKKDTELEISWEPGLKETTTEIVKKKTKHKDGLSPWEEYLEKKKEKQKQKREKKSAPSTERDDDDADDDVAMSDDELPSDVDLNDPYFKEELAQTGDEESKKTGKKKKKRISKEEKEEMNKKEAELALLMMDEDDGKAHFSLKGIQDQEKTKKKKRKLKKKNKGATEPVQDGFELNVEDPRFTDIYQNPLFNIDPSAPEFKKTKATERLIEEKQKRRIEDKKQDKRKLDSNNDTSAVKRKKSSTSVDSVNQKDTSLSSLVKSVKAKTKTLQEKKKKKLK